MGNVYGLRIGDAGIEFPSREDRDKAMLAFTRGSSTKVSDYGGPRYHPGKDTFSTYERDSAQQLSNCDTCKGVFLAETCPKRTIPYKDFDGKFTEGKTEQEFLCDGCYAQRLEEKRLHDAKRVVAAAEPA